MEEGRLLFRVSEVAKQIGCSTSEAYKLVASGAIPSIKIAGLLRVPASALTKLIEEKLSDPGR